MKHLLQACAIVAVALTTAAASLPPPFDMRVESCATHDGGWKAVTTGAQFDVRPDAGEIAFSQRISAQRSLGAVRLPGDLLRGLKRISHSGEVAVLEAPSGLRLEVHCDSVLSLTFPRPQSITISGSFRPEYLQEQQGAAMALDEHGGFGAYFFAAQQVHPTVTRGGSGFTLQYDMPADSRLLLSVCPPREYNWRQDCSDHIVHYFPSLIGKDAGWSDHPLPSDEELTAWRKFTNVLVLHLETWNGYTTPRPQLRDPKRTHEVIALARKLGYRTLLYCSPLYYSPAYVPFDKLPADDSDPFISGGKLRDDAVGLFLDHTRWMLDTLDLDGLYWDGVFIDVPKAWELARRTREMLGSRLFYFHATLTPLPWHSLGVYCPFVDTWTDYILRGEDLDRRRVDPIYLRYEVSGLNISNAIGTLCYDTCRVDKTMIDWALEANVRIPYWPGAQTLGGRPYFLSPEEDKVYREYYLPRLAAIQGPEDYARLAPEGFRSREARRAELARQRQANEAALARYLADQRAEAGPQAAANLAAFKPATCSDYTARPEGPHGLGYPVQYATDLNPDTYWAADTPPWQWLCVDLEKVQTIRTVKVTNYHGDKRFYHYYVEVSPGGKKWQQVGEKRNDALATAEGDTYTFAPCQARYVRVTMLSNSANCGVHIAEIEVYQ